MIEQNLNELARYGEPLLFMNTVFGKSYWACTVDMRINVSGATFKIQGRADSAGKAVEECVRLMHQAIENLNNVNKTPLNIGMTT